jgi:hypothetical protein
MEQLDWSQSSDQQRRRKSQRTLDRACSKYLVVDTARQKCYDDVQMLITTNLDVIGQDINNLP